MSDQTSRPIVAIDGPAGAGKSTAARRLAQRLGYVYIDTGAMYRAVALCAQRAGTPYDAADDLTKLARSMALRFEPDGEASRLFVGDEDISAAIRTPEVSRHSSEVSRWPGVREAMVAHQRRMAEGGGVVMEGRDIGTVVFPDARAKIFLTATPEERARRRTAELEGRGEAADYDDVLREVIERDRRDMEREHSPLRKAEDAVEVLTDDLTLEQVVERMAELVHERER